MLIDLLKGSLEYHNMHAKSMSSWIAESGRELPSCRFRTASRRQGSAPRVWRPALRGCRPRSSNRNTESKRKSTDDHNSSVFAPKLHKLVYT